MFLSESNRQHWKMPGSQQLSQPKAGEYAVYSSAPIQITGQIISVQYHVTDAVLSYRVHATQERQ